MLTITAHINGGADLSRLQQTWLRSLPVAKVVGRYRLTIAIFINPAAFAVVLSRPLHG
jgi:hypothetical protein